jgi:hyperosmotically inducible periplasmic protein
MRTLTTAAAMAIAAFALAACDRPATKSTAYNNSGNSAAAGSTTAGNTSTPSPSTSTATPDTSAPNAPATTSMAPGPAGDATGAVSETMTTGKIKAALAADSGLRDSDISVSTNNGIVTLTGTAKSQEQVSAAVALAQRQDGVTRVENNIAVK